MTYKDFAAWLEGVIDSNPEGLDADKLKIISGKIKTLTFPGEPKKQPGDGAWVNPYPNAVRC
jgi:hypothetical protein